MNSKDVHQIIIFFLSETIHLKIWKDETDLAIPIYVWLGLCYFLTKVLQVLSLPPSLSDFKQLTCGLFI